MARDIDERKKRKALRKLRKAQDLADQGLGPPLSDWERSFLEDVEARVESYGAAFGDPDKGNLDEPLSALQQAKLKEIDRKARGKTLGRGGFSTARAPSSAQSPETGRASEPDPAQPAEPAAQTSPHPFRVIQGGRRD